MILVNGKVNEKIQFGENWIKVKGMFFFRRKRERIEAERIPERVASLLQRFEEAIRSGDDARATIYANEIVQLLKLVCGE